MVGVEVGRREGRWSGGEEGGVGGEGRGGGGAGAMTALKLPFWGFFEALVCRTVTVLNRAKRKVSWLKR